MDNDMITALKRRLSPEGQAVVDRLVQYQDKVDLTATWEDLIANLQTKFVPLMEQVPRQELSSLRALMDELVEGQEKAGDEDRPERLQAINRAAELEGVDPSTLSWIEADLILEQRGEVLQLTNLHDINEKRASRG